MPSSTSRAWRRAVPGPAAPIGFPMPSAGMRWSRRVAPMAVDPTTALTRLRDAAARGGLDELCGHHGVRLLVAFGSAVREADRPPNDLDIAVAFEPGRAGDAVGLLADLSEVAGTGDLDLMDLDRGGPVARERALVACVPLFEWEPGTFARMQMAAMLERMDTAWLRRLDLEAMAG